MCADVNVTSKSHSAGSWTDRLTGRIEQARWPEAPVYVLAWLAVLSTLTVAQWASGTQPVGTVRPFHVVVTGFFVGLPWLTAVFNRAARRAIREVEPLVIGGPARAAELEADLVHAPGRLTLALGLVFAAAALLRLAIDPSRFVSLGFSDQPPAVWLEIVFIPLFAVSVISYATKIAHLARQVHRITTRELAVHLWNVAPLHEFSSLTALMAASSVLVMTALLVTSPQIVTDTLALVGLSIGTSLTAAVFVLPLVGLHGQLVDAKQQAQADVARQMERTLAELRTAIEGSQMSSMDPLNKGIGALEIAQRAIDRVPTWPWSPETFRWVVGALMFPIVLFVAQYVISRTLPA